MDASRTALRLGAQESVIVYRRSREEMPARAEEIHHAEEEGVQFKLLATPLAIHGDEKGRVKELECIQTRLGEPDASGRRRPVPIERSNFRIPADTVIIAIGQSPSPLIPKTTPDLKTERDGVVVIENETGKTSKKGVFAGGDVATGGATVILAMGQGKKAAKAIDEYLKTGQW
jgi:glutamate synthase (NADPH/NADH) small chain